MGTACVITLFHIFSMCVYFWTIQRYVFVPDVEWSLGQIIALTVWTPVLCKLVYTLSCKPNLARSHSVAETADIPGQL